MTQLEILACLADFHTRPLNEWEALWPGVFIDWYSSRSPEYSILTHLAHEAAESLKP